MQDKAKVLKQDLANDKGILNTHQQQQKNERKKAADQDAYEIDLLVDRLRNDQDLNEGEEQIDKEDQMFMYWPGDVRKFHKACLEKFPKHQSTIDKAFNDLKNYKWYENESQDAAMLQRMKEKENMLQKYARKVSNVSFE